MLRFSLFIIHIMLFTSVSQGQFDKLSCVELFFNNLTGTWLHADENTFEQWIPREGVLEGRSFSIVGSDTLIHEKLALVKIAGKYYYRAEVIEQNNGQPIDFELQYCSSDSVKFSNSRHDFPQNIQYLKRNPDSFSAVISGTRDGKYRQIVFEFIRSE